jgi:hypothetical protein
MPPDVTAPARRGRPRDPLPPAAVRGRALLPRRRRVPRPPPDPHPRSPRRDRDAPPGGRRARAPATCAPRGWTAPRAPSTGAVALGLVSSAASAFAPLVVMRFVDAVARVAAAPVAGRAALLPSVLATLAALAVAELVTAALPRLVDARAGRVRLALDYALRARVNGPHPPAAARLAPAAHRGRHDHARQLGGERPRQRCGRPGVQGRAGARLPRRSPWRRSSASTGAWPSSSARSPRSRRSSACAPRPSRRGATGSSSPTGRRRSGGGPRCSPGSAR